VCCGPLAPRCGHPRHRACERAQRGRRRASRARDKLTCEPPAHLRATCNTPRRDESHDRCVPPTRVLDTPNTSGRAVRRPE
jgi:hypothetical protein